MAYLMVLVFGTSVCVFLTGYIFIFGERITLAHRVDQVVGSSAVNIRERELSVPLAHRVLKPLLNRLTNRFVRTLPSEKVVILEQKLLRAGLAGRINPLELMVIKYLLSIFLGLGAILAAGLSGLTLVQTVLVSLCCALAGLLLPESYLTSKAKRRQAEVEQSLPHILDLLTVSVEAGLGFDGAIHKVIGKSKGVLVDEFKIMMQEIKVGKVRREALKDLARRFDVNDLNNFVSAIILGEQLGISIGNVLRRQADQIRLRRRQQAEEKAMKAPVKMLFPLVLLIFPALFIVILGPGAIQISKSLF